MFSAFLFISPAFSATLPSGYTELEYIESSGTQYIDTGIVPANGFGFDIDVMPLTNIDTESWAMVLGSSNFNSGRWGGVLLGTWPPSGLQGQATWFRREHWYDPGFVAYTRCTMKNVNNHFTSSTGKDYDTPYSTNTEISGNLYLFAIHSDQTVYTGAGVRMYSCKLYSGSTVVRDFVPAMNPSGVVGLYDTVNNKFYTNSSTGTFTAGPAVVAPCGSYTELEYIESSGTQVIDTGFVYDNNTRVIWDMQMTTQLPLSANNNSGVGYVNTEYERLGLSFSNSTLNLYKAYSSDSNPAGGTRLFTINTDNNRHVIEINSPVNKAYVDGIEYTFNSAVGNINNNHNLTLPLFAWFANDYQSGLPMYREYFTGRMYSVKIYDNGTLARNMVPARNSDGVVGLCDTVNDKFYTNSGTGTFIAGPVVLPCGYTRLEYIEGNTVVTERHSIDTGVIANNDVLSIDFDMQWINPTSSSGGVLFEAANPNVAGNGIMFGGRNGQWFNIIAGSSFNEFGTLNNDRIVANWTIDGTAGTSVISGDISNTVTSLSHFGNNVVWRSEPVKIGNKGNYKYYSIKIKLNNVFVRDFIPVKRNSDNEVGLYDTVNNVFYTNSGTGTFTGGPEIVSGDICSTTITIHWGGLSEPDASGMCVYGETFTAPSTAPTAPSGLKFLGWIPR